LNLHDFSHEKKGLHGMTYWWWLGGYLFGSDFANFENKNYVCTHTSVFQHHNTSKLS